LSENPTFSVVIEVRAVAVLAMVDQGIEDLKLICVPPETATGNAVKTHSEVHLTAREIEHILLSYKDPKGNETETRVG